MLKLEDNVLLMPDAGECWWLLEFHECWTPGLSEGLDDVLRVEGPRVKNIELLLLARLDPVEAIGPAVCVIVGRTEVASVERDELPEDTACG